MGTSLGNLARAALQQALQQKQQQQPLVCLEESEAAITHVTTEAPIKPHEMTKKPMTSDEPPKPTPKSWSPLEWRALLATCHPGDSVELEWLVEGEDLQKKNLALGLIVSVKCRAASVCYTHEKIEGHWQHFLDAKTHELIEYDEEFLPPTRPISVLAVTIVPMQQHLQQQGVCPPANVPERVAHEICVQHEPQLQQQ